MKHLLILIVCVAIIAAIRRSINNNRRQTETKTTVRVGRSDPTADRIRAEKQQIQLMKNRNQFEKLQHQAEAEKLKRYQAEADYHHYQQQMRELMTAFEDGPKAEKATKAQHRHDDQLRKLDKKREQALAAWKMI